MCAFVSSRSSPKRPRRRRICLLGLSGLRAGGRWIRTLGPPATVSSVVALVARLAARDRGVEADAAVQPASFCSASHSMEPIAHTVLVGCGLSRCWSSCARWKRLLVPVQELRVRRFARLSTTSSAPPSVVAVIAFAERVGDGIGVQAGVLIALPSATPLAPRTAIPRSQPHPRQRPVATGEPDRTAIPRSRRHPG